MAADRIIKVAIITYLGIVIQLAGIALAIFFYTGRTGESYSFLHHFVSGLGGVQRSPIAWVFNSCTAIGSLMFAPVVCALGRRIGTRLGYVAMVCGLVTVLAGSAAGVFSTRYMTVHWFAAGFFFWAWFFTVALFVTALYLGKNTWKSPFLMGAGIGALVVCGPLLGGAFLILPQDFLAQAIHLIRSACSPDAWRQTSAVSRSMISEIILNVRNGRVWWLALTEWGVILSIWIWMATVATVLWLKSTNSSAAGADEEASATILRSTPPN